MVINLIQREPERYTLQDITNRLQKRFEQTKLNNPRGYVDAFQSRFELHCAEISEELHANFEIDGEDIFFSWV